MFTNQRILVTGGTGRLGRELIRHLLEQRPDRIVVFSRGEPAQAEMKRLLDDARLTFRIGDVRDKEALMRACEGIDYVFHLAALKQADACEDQPREALRTNVLGTQNVIEAAIANTVKQLVYMSADRTAETAGFFGMTKAIGEKLVAYANLLRSETTFVCLRGSAVAGGSGNVADWFGQPFPNRDEIRGMLVRGDFV